VLKTIKYKHRHASSIKWWLNSTIDYAKSNDFVCDRW